MEQKRPFHIYDEAVKKHASGRHALRCLALCHGHNHSNRDLQKIKGLCYWYCVDINPACYPDYVCDITDDTHMSIFPDNYFDIIMLLYASISADKYKDALQNIKRIVKPNGHIYVHGSRHMFYYHYNMEQIAKVHQDLLDIMGYEELDLFSIKYIGSYSFYQRIVCNQYKGLYKNEVKEYMNNKGIEFEKLYFESNGFTIIAYKDKYTIITK